MKDPGVGKCYIRVVVKKKNNVDGFRKDPDLNIDQDEDGKHGATPEKALYFI